MSSPDFFINIQHVPHFYMIRSIESRLLSDFIDRSEGPFLDLGCGDGSFARSLGLSDVYGLDIDEKMIAAVRLNDYYREVSRASASAMPYADSFFKTVFSNCALEHMDALRSTLQEVRRVLRDGGKLIFTVPTKAFFELLRRERVLNIFSLDAEAVLNEYNKIHHHVNILSLEEWEKILKDSGFDLLKHAYYLPGLLGRFVARMDILYTIERDGSKDMRDRMERSFRSLKGLPLRLYFNLYLKRPFTANSGTHLILKVVKA